MASYLADLLEDLSEERTTNLQSGNPEECTSKPQSGNPEEHTTKPQSGNAQVSSGLGSVQRSTDYSLLDMTLYGDSDLTLPLLGLLEGGAKASELMQSAQQNSGDNSVTLNRTIQTQGGTQTSFERID